MFSSPVKTGRTWRWWQGGAVCLLAVLMLGADTTGENARFGRVGHTLMCVCGCGQILLECNHVGCPDSARMIGELRNQISGQSGSAGGGSDTPILNWFAAKYGGTVLAAPIRGGFDNVAWILPLGLFLFGTVGTGFLVKIWAGRRTLAVTPAGPIHLDVNDALRERIRRETEF